MPLKTDDAALHAAYTDLVTKTVMECDAEAEKAAFGIALMHARNDAQKALEDVKTYAFGVVDAKNARSKYLETEKLARAKERYIKAQAVLIHMEKHL